MQTFLPFANFKTSASCLDMRRLGKQRVEAWQILQALTPTSDTRRGWANHPAVRQWAGHTYSLVMYGIDVCNEWINRIGVRIERRHAAWMAKFEEDVRQDRRKFAWMAAQDGQCPGCEKAWVAGAEDCVCGWPGRPRGMSK